MKKSYLVLTAYFIYLILLFLMASHYTIVEENLPSKGLDGLGQGLGLFFQFIAVSFFSSSAFLIIAFLIANKLSILSFLLAPFLNIAVSVIIMMLLNFLLWITQLEDAVSYFHKIFIIATISTILTTIWLLGDIFNKTGRNENTI